MKYNNKKLKNYYECVNFCTNAMFDLCYQAFEKHFFSGFWQSNLFVAVIDLYCSVMCIIIAFKCKTKSSRTFGHIEDTS